MRKRIAKLINARPGKVWRRARHLVALVEALPAPAFLADKTGKPVCANGEAEILVRALDREDGKALRALIAAGSAGTAASGCIVLDERAFSIQIAPVAGLVFVAAREITFERNAVNALARSRGFYRDLVACTCDFAWATDENGVFTFISEDGAAGHSASALHGRPAEMLLAAGKAGRAVFSARAPLCNAAIVLRDAKGREREFSVSAFPVRDAAGLWRGARGVASEAAPAAVAPVRLAAGAPPC